MAFLLVIPSIDIKNGKTVRIVQGIPELHCNEYGSDPVEMAKIWRAENSKMLHIVDFDALHGDKNKNVSLLEEICNSVIIPVEFAGGIRTLEDANKYFNLGVSRIAISTLALENLPEFKKIFDTFGPKKIVVSLDVIDNEIVIKGRKIKTGILPIAFALKLREIGVERFIVTDVKRNGMMLGPNIELSRAIADATQAKVTLSGGIRNKDELMDVQALLSVGVDSVIVGRALYENRFPCQKLWRVAELGIFN
ncbi:MAG: 1-(5-phosphoribosyl)-5-[(5-phosphoribosylamino)methylideneamino] imidazole-4-carboxamide isomerase [Ignavibacteria bacterium CG_4_8_14_3_um_filter_37_9]|nr:1-(5-phosphoribosyl)-5-[(5-phosphoribosylamino)methylideneamino] imidazole-4-carboxamide isomerase [Ignavibacteria bacterium]OIO23106.1 MAG: 1-(5-phosphoribosyl)-5-((5-phosphoribosylamino)methylideneamino)imidazole-4-carboxamide isomerase [Ignavibacteria bacterium CG1_02_37_35]PIS45928.1 MAG: 1-(5-phosphoribosyl)-5-[(5-phosphoribosylamino)methylideneamino] imidazole-4-carboxamide isomerase [Ignavibacteria bacterium CG08_land_8_20_14_0_20_37_9]PIW98618.1 MAG: 1-(5-phosphoribosyl)-5-[(5-phospho